VSRLNTSPNVAHVDDIYQSLVDLHAGCSEPESMRINARLILLLVNHIGDTRVISEAVALAGQPPKSQTP
jgi:Protein of unknown function (DUF2783)